MRSLGDLVLTTPGLLLLRRARPDLRVVLVAERPFHRIVRGSPAVSSVISVSRGNNPLSRLKTAWEIRRERPAMCINLHGGSTSAWLTRLSGARFRIGYDHYRFQWAYNTLVPRAQEILERDEDAVVHTAEHHAAAMFYLGVPRSEIPRARIRARAYRAEQSYALIHVAAAYESKRWDIKHFRGLGAYLREGCGIEPVFIATPAEAHLFEQLEDFTCLDDLTISQLKALSAGARLFVGNDSGPAHVAAACGTPVVAIFGSSDSAIWGPWKTEHRIVQNEFACNPCAGDYCREYSEPKCIQSISFEQVQAAVDDILDRTEPVPPVDGTEPAFLEQLK